MVSKEKVNELNTAIEALKPDIYFLSMLIGKIEVPSDKKNDINKAVDYISKYYEIKKKYKDAGLTKEISSDLEYEEENSEWYISFSESWNKAVNRIKNSGKYYSRRNVTKVVHGKNSEFKVSGKILGKSLCHEEVVELFPEETCNNPIFLKEQKAAIRFAVERKYSGIEKRRPSEQEIGIIYNLLFDCGRILQSFEEGQNLDSLSNNFCQILEWMKINIGKGERVGSYRMLEYAEEIGDKIEELYFNEIPISELNILNHNLMHLVFRIAAYYGDDYENILDIYDGKHSINEFAYDFEQA